MIDNLVDSFMIFYERDNGHPSLSLAQIQSQFAKDEKALVEIVHNEAVAGSLGGFRLEVV